MNVHQAEALLRQAVSLHHAGQLDQAETLYEYVLAVDPRQADALHRLGLIALQRKNPARAAELISGTLAVHPEDAVAHCNLGLAHQQLQQPQAALRCFERAIALRHSYALAYANRGVSLRQLGRLQEALISYDRAIGYQPDLAVAHTNRAVALGELDRCAEALESHARALALEPENATVRFNAALLHLLTGRLESGWDLYESRPTWPTAAATEPMCRGHESIRSKTLLLRSEQGLGDTIQFSRYALLAEARGAQVALSAPDRLHRLLGSLSHTIRLVGETERPEQFDLWCPLLSMPLALGTTLETIPRADRYLAPDAARVARWRERLGNDGFRIGICWQGNPDHRYDVGRSPGLARFAPLASVTGVRLISLQKHHGTDQLKELPAGMLVEDLGADFDSGPDAFLDTAAVIESLDLVVSSDTAVAHLAGALGRETWVPLRKVPDWRWLLDRDDSPWYPRHRLFRQRRVGDWEEVFAAMRDALLARLRP